MRSTPTPKDCLRTVNVSRAPWPWRLMTTPSNTCTRLRAPSITWKWTLTRSPGAKLGTRRNCARSMDAMTLLMTVKGGGASWQTADAPRSSRPARGAMVANSRPPPPHQQGAGRSALALRGSARAPFAAGLAPPKLDLLVMAGQQPLGHAPAAEVGRSRVVGIL